MAPLLGGRGGGKPAMAQGGGEDAAGIDDAVQAARATLGLS
jgi:alanyl-tRNA synthetase